MKLKMMAVLFLAGMMSRCVFVAHGPVVARFYPISSPTKYAVLPEIPHSAVGAHP